ncbi:hypothetical protein N9Z18_02255 [Verrucomicrobiales bacterium]|nr:hypothetical protein [Verrucomicrobiales bacterium]
MMAQVVSESGHILLLVSVLAWLGRAILKSPRGAVIGFAIGAVLSVLPLEYSPQFYTRSVLGDLSALSWLFLVHLLCRSIYGVTAVPLEQGRAMSVFAVLGGLLIYPASLGAPWPDFYRLGFDSDTLIYSVAVWALVYVWHRCYWIGVWVVVALLGFGLSLLESLNFWDCLFDYPSFVVAFFVLWRWVVNRSRGKPDLAQG